MLLDIFKTSIFKIKIKNNFYKEYFIKILNEEKIKNKTAIKKSNVGGFQSDAILKINNKEILKNVFLNPAREFSNKLNPRKNFNLYLNSFWINSNKKKDYNLLHNHPNSNISGVYYIQVPKLSGKLVFQNGDFSKFNDINFNYFDDANFYCRYFCNVEEYDLYLFNSSTVHFVEPNRSNKERISVAFNVNINEE